MLNLFFYYIKNLLSHILHVWSWCVWHQKVNQMDLLSRSFLMLADGSVMWGRTAAREAAVRGVQYTAVEAKSTLRI